MFFTSQKQNSFFQSFSSKFFTFNFYSSKEQNSKFSTFNFFRDGKKFQVSHTKVSLKCQDICFLPWFPHHKSLSRVSSLPLHCCLSFLHCCRAVFNTTNARTALFYLLLLLLLLYASQQKASAFFCEGFCKLQ